MMSMHLDKGENLSSFTIWECHCSAALRPLYSLCPPISYQLLLRLAPIFHPANYGTALMHLHSCLHWKTTEPLSSRFTSFIQSIGCDNQPEEVCIEPGRILENQRRYLDVRIAVMNQWCAEHAYGSQCFNLAFREAAECGNELFIKGALDRYVK